ncbi:MAG TPA: hypothetical protein VHA82_06835 [Ramlibacter sp.]|uniref:hypothetical protein n=1 Tax=Ramlibacter sp. TaxID=1917967 RepID=UPI002BF4417D|nr:hypothetical protein [Ramlibacter sp.]HVZ43508.1 hypothetical protein [Ramlibacter sp.]
MTSAQTDWPVSALQAFTLRMAGHGFPVSSTLMKHDRLYALQQLQLAHTLADTGLREMAVELFRHFERRQSGLALAA